MDINTLLLSGGGINCIAILGVFKYLFDNGKIVTIGHGINISHNTEIIDVSGKHIYPGLISAGSTLGLQEINAVRATRD